MKGLVSCIRLPYLWAVFSVLSWKCLLPTVGLLAGLGVAAMLYSVVLALGGDIHALYAMLISFVAAIVIFALIVKRLPSSKLWNKVVLKDESRSERGFVSAAPRESLAGSCG